MIGPLPTDVLTGGKVIKVLNFRHGGGQEINKTWQAPWAAVGGGVSYDFLKRTGHVAKWPPYELSDKAKTMRIRLTRRQSLQKMKDAFTVALLGGWCFQKGRAEEHALPGLPKFDYHRIKNPVWRLPDIHLRDPAVPSPS